MCCFLECWRGFLFFGWIITWRWDGKIKKTSYIVEKFSLGQSKEALLAELSQNSSCSSNPSYNIKNKVLKQPQGPFNLQFTAASPGFSHRFSFFFPTWWGHRCAVSWTVCQTGSEVASDTSTDCSGVAAHSSLHTHKHVRGHIPFTVTTHQKVSKSVQKYYSVITVCKWYEIMSIVFLGGSFKKTNRLVIQRGNKCEKCFRREKMFLLALLLFHHAHSDSLITDLCETLPQPVHCGRDSKGRGGGMWPNMLP